MSGHPDHRGRIYAGDCVECDIEVVEHKLHAVEVERDRLLTHLRALRAILATRNHGRRPENVVPFLGRRQP